MNTKSIDVPQRSRYASLTDEVHQCVNPFRIVDVVIPEHIVVRYEGPRMPFVASIHAGKLDRISNEEDRQIVEDEVLIAIFREELHRPSAHISHSVAGTFLTGYRRDASQHFSLLPDFR